LNSKLLREIACDASSDTVLFAYAPDRCVLWNVRHLTKTCEFIRQISISTRIAYCDRSARVYFADWEAGAASAYDLRAGAEMWISRCIKEPWKLMCCATARLIITTAEHKCLSVDATTGEVREVVNGIGDAFCDTRHDLVLIATRALQVKRTLNGRATCRIEHSGTVPSSIWIDDDFVIVSKTRSVVQRFERRDGKERWRHDPGDPALSINQLTVPPESGLCFGCRTDIDKGGWGCTVVALDVDSGAAVRELELPKAVGGGIACMGRAMVFGNGVLWLPDLQWVPFDFSS